ncbi:MAG: hypothetical protein HQK50_19055 [Oligoflexia bacterium]|nr:hypothetical protein [Oligoflexia bacterium]
MRDEQRFIIRAKLGAWGAIGVFITMIALILVLVLVFALPQVLSRKNTAVVNVPLNNNITSIDPANAYDLVSGTVVYQIYETLFEYHYLKIPYTLKPLLAESAPIIQDEGKTYIIKIRKKVKYHPNPCFGGVDRYVKAQDFVNQIKRLAFIPIKSNGWWSFNGPIQGLNEFREKAGTDFIKFKELAVEGLQTPDDHTLVVKLKEPMPQLVYLLAMAHTAPIPIEAIECYDNNFSKVDLGTGPFQLKEWEDNAFIEVVRFKDYREERFPASGDRLANDRGMLADADKQIPFVAGIKFHIFKDFKARWNAFISGKIDLIDNIPKSEINNYITSDGKLKLGHEENGDEDGDDIAIEIFPSLIYWWLAFNMNDPVIGKNKNLRKAIAHAIDMDKFIKTFTNNIGQRANSIFIPGIPGYDPRRQIAYEYDLQKASVYRDAAGKKQKITITFDTRGDDINNQKAAEFIRDELFKIGIVVKIAVNTFPEFLEKARNGKLQFWQGGWALDYPDAINVLQLLSSKSWPPGPNSSYYRNPQFDDYYSQVKKMENGSAKFKMLEKMEDIILEDLPWIMTYYDRKYILYHKRIKNYRHSDLVYNYLKYIKLEN